MPPNEPFPSMFGRRPQPVRAGGESGRSRDELYQRARQLGVKGASRMKKSELAEAIARKG